jgi:hypothetical protein
MFATITINIHNKSHQKAEGKKTFFFAYNLTPKPRTKRKQPFLRREVLFEHMLGILQALVSSGYLI